MTDFERVAYHEAAHAVVAYINSVPVKRISLKPGMVEINWQAYNGRAIDNVLEIKLAGRAIEELFYVRGRTRYGIRKAIDMLWTHDWKACEELISDRSVYSLNDLDRILAHVKRVLGQPVFINAVKVLADELLIKNEIGGLAAWRIIRRTLAIPTIPV